VHTIYKQRRKCVLYDVIAQLQYYFPKREIYNKINQDSDSKQFLKNLVSEHHIHTSNAKTKIKRHHMNVPVTFSMIELISFGLRYIQVENYSDIKPTS